MHSAAPNQARLWGGWRGGACSVPAGTAMHAPDHAVLFTAPRSLPPCLCEIHRRCTTSCKRRTPGEIPQPERSLLRPLALLPAHANSLIDMALYLLFEAASGYGLMEVVEAEEVAAQSKAMVSAVGDLSKFSKMVKLTAFQAFESAEDALQNINDVSEGAWWARRGPWEACRGASIPHGTHASPGLTVLRSAAFLRQAS